MSVEDPNDRSVADSFLILVGMDEKQAVTAYLELKTCWTKDLMSRGAALLPKESKLKLKKIVEKANESSK